MKLLIFVVLLSYSINLFAMNSQTANNYLEVDLLENKVGLLPTYVVPLFKTINDSINDTQESQLNDRPYIPVSFDLFSCLLELFPFNLCLPHNTKKLIQHCKEQVLEKHVKFLPDLLKAANLLNIQPLCVAVGLIFKNYLIKRYQRMPTDPTFCIIAEAFQGLSENNAIMLYDSAQNLPVSKKVSKALFLRGWVGKIPPNQIFQGWGIGQEVNFLSGSKILVSNLSSIFSFDLNDNDAQTKLQEVFKSNYNHEIKGFGWSQAGDVLLALGSSLQAITLASSTMKEKIRHDLSIKSVQFSSDGKRALVEDISNCYALYDLENNKKLSQFATTPRISTQAAFSDHFVGISHNFKKLEIVVAAEGQKEVNPSMHSNVVGKSSCCLSLIDVATGRLVYSFRGVPEISISTKCILDKTGRMVGLDGVNDVLFADLGTGAVLVKRKPKDSQLLDITENYFVFAQSKLLNVYQWSPDKSKSIVKLRKTIPTESIIEQGKLTLNEDLFIGMGKNANWLDVWDVKSGNHLTKLYHESAIADFKISRDDMFVIASGAGRTTAWNLIMSEEIKKVLRKLSLEHKALVDLALHLASEKKQMFLQEGSDLKKFYDTLPRILKKGLADFFVQPVAKKW